MTLEPIQQVAVLIAASAMAFLMALHLTLESTRRRHSGSWSLIARESGLGILTGGFMALASLAGVRILTGLNPTASPFSPTPIDAVSFACVLVTLVLLCSERDGWKGHQPATVLAAVVPWLLVPGIGVGVDGRLPAELIGLASAALYRVAFSGAHSFRMSSRARHAAVEATGDGVLVVDLEGRLIEGNVRGHDVFGALATASPRQGDRQAAAPPQLPERVRSLLKAPEAKHFSLRNSADHVFEIWLGSAESSRRVGPNRALIIRDVSDQRRDEKHLNRIAHYDSLTGLANRRQFINHLESALAGAKQARKVVALLYIDLDRFKEINDTLGHGAGDQLLRVIALRFQKQVQSAYGASLRGPAPASVARLGGDEFAVVIPEPDNLKEVEKFCHGLLRGIGQPVKLSGREVASSGSIGIAMYPKDGEDVETLVKHADSALYGAKRSGRNRYQQYRPEFSRAADRTRVIEQELRGAIERSEFQLHYQPKVDIASGTVAGLEALIRWKSRELGPVGPDEFIPIAEERGLIAKIGGWCLDEACQQILRWQNAGYDPPPVAVNVSSAQFIGSKLQDRVTQALEDSGVPPELLELELTERLLLEDDEQTSQCLKHMQTMGISLALDDFGTGYSALTYLNRFPLNVVKMDRGLLIDIETSESAAGIAAAVISMCHSLGLKVVAEGVDAEGQLTMLREMGCDLIQGFLFAPALQADDVTPMLAECGEPRPVLAPKADEATPPASVFEEREEQEVESGVEDWEDPSIDLRPEREPIQHAVFFDGNGKNFSLIDRLGHLGVRLHEVTRDNIENNFVAPGGGQANLIVFGSDVDLEEAQTVLDGVRILDDGMSPKIVVAGEEPSPERRDAFREMGATLSLWTPYGDPELRFLVREVMPSGYEGRDRMETRVPMDAMAWIRARARREVGVLSSLSRRGAFIDMEEPPDAGSSMRLEFEIPTGRVSTFAKVVYQRVPGDSPRGGSAMSGVGVTFYGLDPASEFSIGELVDANSVRFVL